MKIKKRHVDDISILELDGMLTLGSEEAVADALKELDQLNRHKIILDLMKVKYIDSIGIGQIAEGANQIKAKEGYFSLVRVNQRIESMLGVTGLKKIIPIHETLEDAMNAM